MEKRIREKIVKKEIDNTMVNSITDFEDTLIWMSARKWLWSDAETELEPDYPTKMVERYWNGLSEIQREKLIIDVKREMESGWSDKERCGRLLRAYSDAQPGTFVPYLPCDDFEFVMIRLAIMYACGRQTISCSMLPSEITKHRLEDLAIKQKNIIVKDLTDYLDRLEANNMERVFGDKRIDDNGWQIFLLAMTNE
jgi:hypothetical protein